ncbi:hypothetical protein [Massilia sp. TS11]|uniref:hypothetical protein n=1 Tax=Massilia sp. TS11 TaxID=2908003 RepID=UPI001EDB4692|nr:hypothetical protein [Massilia sp. TS11]MCG2584512.1 hypothetical protein [Massilia sp. TS11]
MRLPGTRYQEPGWEQVRKLLGQCSLQVLPLIDVGDPLTALDEYVEAMAAVLAAQAGSARAQAVANQYGDSVLALAQALVLELRARPADWDSCCRALLQSGQAGEAALRKQFNDLYAVLRDKVDAENYQVACGRPCSPNKMYTYRMLDRLRGEVAALLAGWPARREEVAAVLGMEAAVLPLAARQGHITAEWLIAWSATRERFTGAPGPLHTRSKRFASLRNQPATIAAMLEEIAEHGALTASSAAGWAQDAADHGAWLVDLWRVLDESEAAEAAGRVLPDCLLAAPDDSLFAPPEPEPDLDADVPPAPLELTAAQRATAVRLALPADYLARAAAAEQGASWVVKVLSDVPIPVKLAVYLKIFGPRDDTYPDEWLDPATGALPTLQQLAELADLSLPTLRKRREAAIASLQAAPRPKGEVRGCHQ